MHWWRCKWPRNTLLYGETARTVLAPWIFETALARLDRRAITAGRGARPTRAPPVIRDPLAGEYNYPVRVVAFNTSEGWSRDVTLEIADEVARRFITEPMASRVMAA